MGAWLFDLDGVLVNSVAAYSSAWRRWAKERGISESAIWVDAHGKRPEDIIGRVTSGSDLESGLRAFDEALAAAAAACKPMPDAVECLATLDPGSWAIVTSGRRGHVRACLQHCGLPVPRVLVCGDEVSRGKPDPECYLAAAAGLAVEPAACAVVEDAPVGIDAAHAAGMRAIAITNTHSASELLAADEIYSSLRDLTASLHGDRAYSHRSHRSA